MPERTTPKAQGQKTVLENGAGGRGGLIPARGANQPPTLRGPSFAPATAGTEKAVRPEERGIVPWWQSTVPAPAASSDSLQPCFLLHLGVGGVIRVARERRLGLKCCLS